MKSMVEKVSVINKKTIEKERIIMEKKIGQALQESMEMDMNQTWQAGETNKKYKNNKTNQTQIDNEIFNIAEDLEDSQTSLIDELKEVIKTLNESIQLKIKNQDQMKEDHQNKVDHLEMELA